MAHGTADYNISAGSITTYQLTDLGELAARLGSIDVFDRRGEVLFIDDFTSPAYDWLTSTQGAGSTVDLSKRRLGHGDVCLRLVAGSDGSAFARVIHRDVLPVLSLLSAELIFSLPASTSSVELLVTVATGAQQQTYGVRVDNANDVLSARDSGGVFQPIYSQLNLSTLDTLPHRLKLVVDPTNATYSRVLFDGIGQIVPTVTPQISASAAAPLVIHTVTNNGNLGENDICYLLGFIYKHNEPT